MKKAILGGAGKSDTMRTGKPSQIITHITSQHAKGNIFEGSSMQHPKASKQYANGEKSGSGMKMC